MLRVENDVRPFFPLEIDGMNDCRNVGLRIDLLERDDETEGRYDEIAALALLFHSDDAGGNGSRRVSVRPVPRSRPAGPLETGNSCAEILAWNTRIDRIAHV